MSLTCVQCRKELRKKEIWYDYNILGNSTYLYFCDNPKCPNYGLYQVGVEEMPKEEGEDNEKK